ncbi:MAG TPA: hypothetical protein VK506_10645 [Conexibacter sp.]|nr:hypothetical protein [Conexibacter sp.]
MRIGGIYEWKQNAHYRVLIPLHALGRRGHDPVFARAGSGEQGGALAPERIAGCDVVHGYRQLTDDEVRVVRRLVRAGAAFVWDTDDDLRSVPRGRPRQRRGDGPGAKARFARTVELALSADVVTTSTEPLAELYRSHGAARVEVLGNYLDRGAGRKQRKHDGIVIGWLAGLEHAADVARIPVVEALRRLLDAHPEVRVETIGLDLGLPADRYACDPLVDFERLQDRMARWDVAIAPLVDIPFNLARSDVKLKEYASVGLPWLASPVGPYVGYGESEGGRLVADGDWFEALERLVGERRERAKLGKRARRWAKTQSIERHVERWERVYAEAIERRQLRR